MATEESFGEFSTMYPKQKIKSLKKRLKEDHDYTDEDITILFKQYDIDANPDNLEKLEDDILSAEKTENAIKEDNKEDNLDYVSTIKESLSKDYNFNDKETRKIISQCIGSLYTTMTTIDSYSKVNKMQEDMDVKKRGLLEILNIKI